MLHCFQEFQLDFPSVFVDYKQFRERLDRSDIVSADWKHNKKRKLHTPEVVDTVEEILENGDVCSGMVN
jgi:hypothetical protein